MKTKVKMLKVKIKSLAVEARIIRLEEKRAGKNVDLRNQLHTHRVYDVRREQRFSLIAYAFLRGVPYPSLEPKTNEAPDWQRVAKLVEKFGTTSWAASDRGKQSQEFEAWRMKPVAAVA